MKKAIVLFLLTGCILNAGWAQPVQKEKSKEPTEIIPHQPRDKESAALSHLSAAYRVEEIQFGRTGLPEFIRGDLTPAGATGDAAETAYAFFTDNAALFTMKNPRQELRVTQTETDEYGMTHVTLLQYAGSVPVFTGDWKAHLSSDGRLRSINGEYHAEINIPLQASVSAQAAKPAVLKDLGAAKTEIRFRGEPELWVYPSDGIYYLCWHAIVDGPELEAWRYFVNARDGRVVHRIPLFMPERPPTDRGGGVPRNSTPDTDVLDDLGMHALEGVNSQIVFGREGTWIRQEGEYGFRPATAVTDFAAAAEQELARQAQRAAADWRDFVLDLRAPGALAAAQARGLELAEMAEPGYYRTRTTKQVVNELSAEGIDAADFPHLPAVRGIEREDEVKSRIPSNPLDEVLISQNFEGIFPPTGWQVGDANATNGLDYWDDANCQYHGGGWSGWCADEGDMPDCVNYDDYMQAYMVTAPIDVWGRSHLNVNYWWRNISEPGYDYFRMYVSLDANSWVLAHEHNGNAPAWAYYAINVSILGGGDWLWVKFEFFSDYSVHNYAGAYVDDFQVTGDWASCGFAGLGTGMMGQWFDHIDDSWNGSTYILQDKSRVADPWGQNCQHGHEGQMGNNERIVSWNGTDLVHYTDADNVWNAPTGVDNLVYQTAFYDFMRIELGRNSYNNAGSSMYAVVNGTGCTDNAFGGGQTLLFCQPSANRRGTGGAPDVVGHEWGHSLTNTESNLIYQRESGALNEAFSDILGASFGIQTGYDANWLIGDFTFTNGNAWRDMVNPQAFGQPDCYLGTNWYPCDPTSCPVPHNGNDQCGVHTNSGVANRMFTLLAEGGTHNNVTVSGIGLMNALDVVYLANRDYWNQNTNMAGGRSGCISAASAINPSWVTSVTNAWAAVCVGNVVETPLNCSNATQLVNGVPFNGTTVDGEGHVLNYNCSTWDESGREKVHWISLGQPRPITVTLSNLGVDLDVFLLSACDDNACVAYGNSSLSYNAAAQIYYVVVDGYYGANGSYTITYCVAPATTVQGTPAEGAMVCSGAQQIYTWNQVAGAADYTIQWDDNTAFSSPVEATTAADQYYQTLTGSGTWYWRVRANAPGTCPDGNWTPARSLQLTPVPGAPALTAPANGATVCSGTVQQYTWSSVPTAFNYVIQWDDDPAFGSPLEQSTANTYYNLTLYGAGNFYWRVKAQSVCGFGSWSAVRTIALIPAPGTVALSVPTEGAFLCSGVSQTYQWAAATGATSYLIQWDDNTAFSSPLEQTTAGTSYNQIITGSGTWYWRVRGANTCGNGAWSAHRSFTLNATPGAPALSNPAEGAGVCSGAAQTYAWNAAAGATSYTIQWANNNGFSSPVEQTTAAQTIVQTLSGSGTWYWRVRANNACGNGSWSATRTFALLATPAVAVMSAPANGSTICSGISQNYAWNAVAGAATYTVQWDDNSGFTTPDEQSTAALSIAQSLTGSGTWYWRVRANNACGAGAWASAWTVILVALPGQAVLTAPANGASIQPGVPMNYCWNAVASATNYTVQWDDNAGFLSPVQATTAGTCYSQSLSGTGTRYWRARAENGCGTGAWSAVRTVVFGTLEAPVVVLWMNGDSLRISWPPVSGATSYLVEAAEQTNGPFTQITIQPDTTHGMIPNPQAIRFYRVSARTQ